MPQQFFSVKYIKNINTPLRYHHHTQYIAQHMLQSSLVCHIFLKSDSKSNCRRLSYHLACLFGIIFIKIIMISYFGFAEMQTTAEARCTTSPECWWETTIAYKAVNQQEEDEEEEEDEDDDEESDEILGEETENQDVFCEEKEKEVWGDEADEIVEEAEVTSPLLQQSKESELLVLACPSRV